MRCSFPPKSILAMQFSWRHKMDALIQALQVKRTWRQKVTLLRQRLYIWRRFPEEKYNDGCVTKRKLAAVLRSRLVEMSRAEGHAYYSDPEEIGLPDFRCRSRVNPEARAKLLKRNLRERRMITSILTAMYNYQFTGPDYFGTE